MTILASAIVVMALRCRWYGSTIGYHNNMLCTYYRVKIGTRHMFYTGMWKYAVSSSLVFTHLLED